MADVFPSLSIPSFVRSDVAPYLLQLAADEWLLTEFPAALNSRALIRSDPTGRFDYSALRQCAVDAKVT